VTAHASGSTAPFWSANQPGFRFTDAQPGTLEFFADVERHRYALEPHIPAIVQFERYEGKRVLEIGCGVATDGISFVRAGASYVGVDQSDAALALAARRLELEGLEAGFARADATSLPFEDRSFDLVYSHGVLHHLADTERAVAEIRRVLRPGGRILLMLYHRNSLNYRFTIMILRRVLAAALLVPGAARLVARATGERRDVIEGHRRLLSEHRRRYLLDKQLFLNNNTDGPGNPLSKVYSREEARRLLAGFDDVQSAVRFLNLRIFPGGARIAGLAAAARWERRVGWHLYVTGTRGPDS
jgi:ubiquinone/menaquinone biosynthesis C-methylase UbiE